MIATTSQTNNTAVPDNDMAKQVKEFLQLLHPNGNPIELRIFPATDGTRSAMHHRSGLYPTSASAAEAILLAESDRPKAICCNLNPIRKSLVDGPSNKSKLFKKDDDIEKRLWLFIDIDSKRLPDTSATKAELECAHKLAQNLIDFLNSQGWPQPAITMSGNGYHVLYRIDQPNTTDVKETIKQVLAALASKFDTEGAEIDTSVYNASRIIKIAGTLARKGNEIIDAQPDQCRPHRQCKLIFRPDVLQPVSLVQLRKIGSTVSTKAAHALGRKSARPALGPPSSDEIVNQAIAHLEMIPPAVSGQGGHNSLFRAACDLVRGFNLPMDQAKELLFDYYNERCQPPWTWDQIGHKVEDAILRATGEPGYLINRETGQPERGNARIIDPRMLAEFYLAGFRSDGHLTLRYWQGEFWRWEAGAYRKFKRDELRTDLTRCLQNEHNQITQGVITNAIINLEALCCIQSRDSATFWIDEDLARNRELPKAQDVIVTNIGLLDINRLGNSDGSFNFLSITPNLFTTTAISIEKTFDNAKYKIFLDFLTSLKLDHQSLELLQDFFGYCLTSDTSKQKFLMMIGPPNSSKGTLLRIIGHVLGEPNVCSATLHSLSERFGLEPMLDKSLVTIGEMRLSRSTDQAIALERLLSIVGEDSQAIDVKYRPQRTVRLNTRIIMAANELPALIEPSGALARRLLVLHLRESFVDNPDSDLLSRLEEAKTEIFFWALVGLQRLRQRGHFVQPAGSQDILHQQLLLTQPVKQFVADRIEINPDGFITKEQAYEIYKDWCAEKGLTAKPQNVFGKDLVQATDQRATSGQVRSNGVKTYVYKGISAKPPSQHLVQIF